MARRPSGERCGRDLTHSKRSGFLLPPSPTFGRRVWPAAVPAKAIRDSAFIPGRCLCRALANARRAWWNLAHGGAKRNRGNRWPSLLKPRMGRRKPSPCAAFRRPVRGWAWGRTGTHGSASLHRGLTSAVRFADRAAPLLHRAQGHALGELRLEDEEHHEHGQRGQEERSRDVRDVRRVLALKRGDAHDERPRVLL